MPERPDLEYVVDLLAREVTGAEVMAATVKKPVVLRVALPGTAPELLPGHRIHAVTRRGHFVRLQLSGGAVPLEVVVSPMLAGRFALLKTGDRTPAEMAVSLELQDGRHLQYWDDMQMGKVYVIPPNAWQHVPGLEKLGVDVLDPAAFTREAFRAMARKRREQAKVFVMDKSLLDSLGNAYADEVLFASGIHPKTRVAELSPEHLDALHDAIVNVLDSARRTIAERKPALPEKVRDFLQVRNRHGERCPRCGGTIRRAGVHGHDAFFCPHCQPETRKGAVVDWRKLPPKTP